MYPLDTFKRCQLCGNDRDICDFDMWVECDENDDPEEDNILIICTKGHCRKRLNDHPRMYHHVPWSAGGPGKFMLLCGECPQRAGGSCAHTNLGKNGGDGLLVTFTPTPLSKSIVCTNNGCGCIATPHPATGCEGLPENHPRWVDKNDFCEEIVDA